METKKRLIDANTLKRHMIKAMELANVKTINKDDIAYAIDNANAVDAVEVVRCRNCRHRHTGGRCAGRPMDFFCADGER